jgi:hypothetical protein
LTGSTIKKSRVTTQVRRVQGSGGRDGSPPLVNFLNPEPWYLNSHKAGLKIRFLPWKVIGKKRLDEKAASAN